MDFDLIPTEDLLEALAARYHTMIFGGIEERDAEAVVYKTRYSGDRFRAMGLGEFLVHDLARETLATEQDVD